MSPVRRAASGGFWRVTPLQSNPITPSNARYGRWTAALRSIYETACARRQVSAQLQSISLSPHRSRAGIYCVRRSIIVNAYTLCFKNQLN